eukprot:SAG11_NODE_37486_length_256_cov_1.649682_1_plen_42_part_10
MEVLEEAETEAKEAAKVKAGEEVAKANVKAEEEAAAAAGAAE